MRATPPILPASQSTASSAPVAAVAAAVTLPNVSNGVIAGELLTMVLVAARGVVDGGGEFEVIIAAASGLIIIVDELTGSISVWAVDVACIKSRNIFCS